MAERLELVGGTNAQKNAFKKLEEFDVCFGEQFSEIAKECEECRAPVVIDGKLFLLREVCRARSKGVEAGSLNRLTSQEVMDRLEEGKSAIGIWKEILGDCDPETRGKEARRILYSRLYYLSNEYDVDTPDVPRYKNMLKLA